MLRYNLRSALRTSSSNRRQTEFEDADAEFCSRHNDSREIGSPEPSRKKPKPSISIFSLPPEMILFIGKYLDPECLLALHRTCHYFKNLLESTDLFWKMLCRKEDLMRYDTLLSDDGDTDKVGMTGQLMRLNLEKMSDYRKLFRRGVQMRKNIITHNFQAWRIFANEHVPISQISPETDVLALKKTMQEVPKLATNDDIKVDWDENNLVIFHFFRASTERAKIWVFDIRNEPRFMYVAHKGTEYVTDKVFVHKGHVVIVPSWPLTAGAVVMTLSIENEMNVVGKFLFENRAKKEHIDQLWMHTVLNVVKDADQALVACRTPTWECLVVDLPSCNLLRSIRIDVSSLDEECQQIRSFGLTAIMLFSNNSQETETNFITVNMSGPKTSLGPVYRGVDVSDVAIFPGSDVIYLLKKTGDIYTYNITTAEEQIKIRNPNVLPAQGAANVFDYQMFVNQDEEICLLQAAHEADSGRFVKVYDFSGNEKFHINLDIWQYGLNRDESLCIYTNGAFLAVANSLRILLFHRRTGKHLGIFEIPIHMERSKGKDNSQCVCDATGLNLMLFDEDRLIAVHDYERAFPSVIDIYKFW